MKDRKNVWIIAFAILVVIFGCWLFLQEEGVEVIDDLTIGD